MKKTFRLLGLAMLTVLLTFGMTSCGDDDDDIDNSYFTEQDGALVGSWQYQKGGNGWSDTETITFYANGTYEETEVETDSHGTTTSWERGIWNTNPDKNQVKFKVTASSDPSDVGDIDVENYSISNGELTLDRNLYRPVTNPQH